MRILITTVTIILSLVYGVDAFPRTATNPTPRTAVKPFRIQSADNLIYLSPVIDNTPPILRNRDTAYVQLGSNDSVVVSPAQIDLGSTDDIGIDTMFVTPNTFTCNNIGFNPVVFTVRDTSGNSSSANVMIYVNSPFVLTDIVDTLEECAPISIQWFGGCSGWNINLSLVRISPFVNQAIIIEKTANSKIHQWQIPSNVPEGFYQLYIEESNKLNWGYGKPFYVKNTPPTVITKNIVLPLDAQGVAKITVGQIDNGSNDICGIDSMTVTPDSFGCSSVGVNTVTLSVTDLNGNTRVATATVTIVDTQVPLISAPTNISIPTDNGSATATNVVLGTPVTSDNCSIASVTNDAPTVYPIGVTVVTWTVKDIHGNTTTAKQTVTVVDSRLPIVTISLPKSEANLDETVSVPLTLVSSSQIDIAAQPTFTARVRYNKTLLLPVGTSQPVTFDGNDAIMEITGKITQSAQILATINFKVVTGNADRTPLVVDTFIVLNQSKLVVNKTNGEILIKDLCRAGDTARLFKRVAPATLVAIRPNPVGTSADIDFVLSESGCTTLTIIDLKGQPVLTVWEADATLGNYTQHVNGMGLSDGEYFLQLRTPNELFTSKLIIRK